LQLRRWLLHNKSRKRSFWLVRSCLQECMERVNVPHLLLLRNFDTKELSASQHCQLYWQLPLGGHIMGTRVIPFHSTRRSGSRQSSNRLLCCSWRWSTWKEPLWHRSSTLTNSQKWMKHKCPLFAKEYVPLYYFCNSESECCGACSKPLVTDFSSKFPTRSHALLIGCCRC
jgi:hypothetical protein